MICTFLMQLVHVFKYVRQWRLETVFLHNFNKMCVSFFLKKKQHLITVKLSFQVGSRSK